jgi:hypothetical protein
MGDKNNFVDVYKNKEVILWSERTERFKNVIDLAANIFHNELNECICFVIEHGAVIHMFVYVDEL